MNGDLPVGCGRDDMGQGMNENLLEVKDLHVRFMQDGGRAVRAACGVSYSVKRGECVAIIGESGSGKTVSALSVLRLIPFPPGIIASGEIWFDGVDLLGVSDREMMRIRGGRIGMIFQEPSAALNPLMTIGSQIEETLLLHTGIAKAEAKAKAVELLRMVDIPNPEWRALEYPHQLSGGMQQRAMIAMAMCCEPDLLIADEPTTALDVTVQAQVLEQLNHIRKKINSALVLITHNLGVVAQYADSVKIMYGGRIVEDGPTREIFYNPQHPYTKGLIKAVPRLDRPRTEELYTIEGEPPDMLGVPEGTCAFADRCAVAEERCRAAMPERIQVSYGHYCACFAAGKGGAAQPVDGKCGFGKDGAAQPVAGKGAANAGQGGAGKGASQ